MQVYSLVWHGRYFGYLIDTDAAVWIDLESSSVRCRADVDAVSYLGAPQQKPHDLHSFLANVVFVSV